MPDRDGRSQWQLYDLDRDRGEVFDLAEAHPRILAELLELWEQYRLETGVIESPLSIFDAEPSAWGIARALRDRNVRSGLAYLLEVARSLGASNGQAPPNHAVSQTDSSTTTQRGVR